MHERCRPLLLKRVVFAVRPADDDRQPLGRGIGRAIALELARLGAGIVVAEVNQETAAETAVEVEQLGQRAMAIRVDVTRPADRQAMVDQTMRTFGRIDVLINNAGIYRSAPHLDITEEHWDSVLAVNSKAVL